MEKIVFPDYDHSLLNITSSILKNYNIDSGYKTLKNLDEILKGNFKNIVFYLIDAMGCGILNKHLEQVSFLNKNKIDDLTTVFPSTTVAATTTAITGLPPAVTGWIGWQQYVKEEDKNVIFFLNQDYYDENYTFNYNVSEKYAKITYIYEKITRRNPNVNTFEIFPEFRIKEHKTILNQVETILKTINNKEKNFIYSYWDKLDTYLHEYGTTSEIISNHLKEIDFALKTLYDGIDENTLVIITADHGQVDIEGINLWEYEDLTSMFEHQPAIEARATAFYIKEDKRDEFEKTFNKYFKNQFVLYKSEEVLEMNLFGKGKKSPRTKGFLGDFFAIAIDKYSFRLQNAKHIHKATHAGLLKDEMMIPLIILNKRLSK
ncbi:MAG: alkaline phosphatase family protein [Spirochaetales bacterium]|nr:alkaline phosphatase family protein [Spirochaetales bacterium]